MIGYDRTGAWQLLCIAKDLVAPNENLCSENLKGSFVRLAAYAYCYFLNTLLVVFHILKTILESEANKYGVARSE